MNIKETPQTNLKRILRLNAVKAYTGLSRSTIYDMMSKGLFPQKIDLGANSVGWVESEISEWIDSRIKARDEVAA